MFGWIVNACNPTVGTFCYQHQRPAGIVESWCFAPVLDMTIYGFNGRSIHCIVTVVYMFPNIICKIFLLDIHVYLICLNSVFQYVIDAEIQMCLFNNSSEYLVGFHVLLFGLVNTSLLHEQHVEPITCEHVFEHMISTITIRTTNLVQHTNWHCKSVVQIL